MKTIQQTVQSVIDDMREGFHVVPIFRFEDKEQVSPMSFQPEHNTICIRTNLLFQYYEKMQEYGVSFLSFRDFVNVVLSHELGHWSDPFIVKREKQKKDYIEKLEEDCSLISILSTINELESVVLEAEAIAWELSHPFIWEHIDRKEVARLIEICLLQYKQRFQFYRETFITERQEKVS